MPTEIRRIVFSNAELLLALMAQNKSGQDSKMPAGAITACMVKDEADGIVHVQMLSENGEPATYSVRHAEVGAALLRFCRDAKIPIPKRGKKSLKVVGEDIALYIET